MSLHGIICCLVIIALTSVLYFVSGGLVSLFVFIYGLTLINAIVNTELYGCAYERD